MTSSQDENKQKNITRRGFIKWTTALVAAGAAVVGVAAGYGGDILLRPSTGTTKTETTTKTVTAPVQTLSYKPPLSPQVEGTVTGIFDNLTSMHAGETTAYSGVTGGSISMGVMTGLYKVHLKNGVITAVEPDDTVNPGVAREDGVLSQQQIVKAHLQSRIKANGYTFPLYLYAPDRLLYPMKRTGARGDLNGSFVRISWQEALDTLANMISTVKSKYGPLSSIGGPLSSYTGIGVSSWGDVSFGAEDVATGWMFGSPSYTVFPDPIPQPKGGVNTSLPIVDGFNTKAVILWGWDPTTAGGTGGPGSYVSYILKLITEKGIPAISVDVRYSAAAKITKAQWIPIRSGTDTAALLALANVLFKEDKWDKTYVANFVEPTGFQQWKDYVLGTSDGVDKTPQWAEPITGIPAQTLTALAEFFASHLPCLFVASCGPGRQYMGDTYARTHLYLMAMMGNLGVSGGAPPYVSPGRPGGLSTPSADYGRGRGSYSAPPLMKSYLWQEAVMQKIELDAGRITQEQYDSIVGKTPGTPNPTIKLYFRSMGNSLNQNVNINRQIQAIKAIDYYVAATYHWSPNAKVSDLVLPVAEVFEDYYGFVSFPTGMVFCPKLVEPQGEAKPMEWIYTQLAQRLGFVDKYMPNYTTDDQWDNMVLAAMKKGYETWASSASVKALNITIPSWDDFVKNPVIRNDNPATPTLPFADQITGGKPFGTASGKIEYVFSYLTTNDPAGTAIGGPLDAMAMYHDQPEGFYDPKVATYPLVKLDTHNRYRSHSAQDSDSLLTENFRHSVWMNPADAKARGINDNDMVRVFNDAGQIVLPAYVTSRLVPGQVYIWDAAWYNPNASGLDKRGCPNVLSNGGFNADAQDPHNDLVQVEKF